MRQNKDYWRRAGNPRFGWQMLARDIQRVMHPRKSKQSAPNTIYRDSNSPHVTEKVNPHFSDTMGKAPTFITNYYPPQNQIYRTMGLWQTLFLILFMTFVAVFTFYLITEPSFIVDVFHKVVEFFHSI